MTVMQVYIIIINNYTVIQSNFVIWLLGLITQRNKGSDLIFHMKNEDT